jgi:hypothetical protein
MGQKHSKINQKINLTSVANENSSYLGEQFCVEPKRVEAPVFTTSSAPSEDSHNKAKCNEDDNVIRLQSVPSPKHRRIKSKR